MPTTIPFDSSLVLGEILPPKRMTALQTLDAAVQPMRDAQDELNSYILLRRSLDMTIQELINLQVPEDKIKEVTDERKTLNGKLTEAAIKVATASTESLEKRAAAQAEVAGATINVSVESPLDLTRSALTKMPLSSDSLKMDAQYFRYESNADDSEAHANAIGVYVSAQTESLFGSKSVDAGLDAKKTVLAQHENHSLEGTLVITATCTHKQAELFAPLVLDPEKAIRAWNAYVQDGPKIDVDDPKSLSAAAEGDAAETAKLFVLSGVTRGSSFVGMVHILRTEKTDSKQSGGSVSAQISATMETGAFIASKSGKFGVEDSFSSNVKSLLSTSDIQAHASVITMGLIPTLKSGAIKSTIKTLKPDAKEVMGQLATVQGATDSDVTSTSAEARKATDGEAFMQMNNAYLESVVSSLGEIENKENKVIDTNSMMTAFDDYIQKAIAGDCGVPINFYATPLSSKMLANAYKRKFFPNMVSEVAAAVQDGE